MKLWESWWTKSTNHLQSLRKDQTKLAILFQNCPRSTVDALLPKNSYGSTVTLRFQELSIYLLHCVGWKITVVCFVGFTASTLCMMPCDRISGRQASGTKRPGRNKTPGRLQIVAVSPRLPAPRLRRKQGQAGNLQTKPQKVCR